MKNSKTRKKGKINKKQIRITKQIWEKGKK